MMAIRIIKRQDGVYDAYDRASGKWLLTRSAPDNILSWLSELKLVWVEFIDETLLKEGDHV